MNSSGLGLENLEWEDFAGNKLFPMAALVVVKAIDIDGNEVYTTTNTEGLTSVDALAMSRFAVLWSEDEVRRDIRAAKEE